MPGAPCSVIDSASSSTNSVPSKDGTIEVPVVNPNGSAGFLRSSNIEVGELKEMRDFATMRGQPFPSYLLLFDWKRFLEVSRFGNRYDWLLRLVETVISSKIVPTQERLLASPFMLMLYYYDDYYYSGL
jgi:hypothetical protein